MFNKIINSSTTFQGIVLVTLYAVFTAGREVFVGNIVQEINPSVLALICFSFISVFFVLLLVKKDGKQYLIDIKINYQNIVGLNISTALFWTCSMYALKFIEPSIVNSIYTAIGPMITFLWLFVCNKNHYQFLKIELFCAMGILSIIFCMVLTTLYGKTGVGQISYLHTLTGIMLCVGAGAGIVANTFFSKGLSQVGMSTNFVLSIRFFLLIIVTLSFSLFADTNWYQLSKYFKDIALLAFFGIGLPLFILQKGIERSDPVTVSFIIVLGPIFTFLFEEFDNRLTLTPYTLLSISLMSLLVIYSIIVRYKIKS